jgi:hypothetical protein
MLYMPWHLTMTDAGGYRGRVSMVGDSDFADFLRVILDVVLSVRS